MGSAEPTSDQHDRDALLRRAELIISGVLRGGVYLSAGLILLGVILYYAHYFYAHYFADGGHGSTPEIPRSLGDIVSGLLRLDSISVISTGLIVLLATPVVRVGVSIVAFALERDRTYVIITSVVLLILLISFFSGRGGG